jgi:hypothetical protein
MTTSKGEMEPWGRARRRMMCGVVSGYTLVLAREAHGGAPVTDYAVTDGGVLFATGDRGCTWRYYGVVDPEMFLLDLGFEEAWELAAADGGSPPAAMRRFLAA